MECVRFPTFGCGNDLKILHNGSSYICNTTASLYLCNTTVSGTYLQAGGHIYINPGSSAYSVFLRYGGTSSTKLSTTNVGVTVTGCGTATDWIASSDCRVKDNIKNIEDPIELTMGLCGICYTRIDTENKNEMHLGFLAQDTEKVIPEVVVKNNIGDEDENYELYKSLGMNEFYGIKYEKIVPVLVEAFKKQRNEFLELKSEFEEYKKNNTS